VSAPFLVRSGQNRPGWRAWIGPVYNVVVVAVVEIIGVTLLLTGSTGRRLGGVVLVVMGAWWSRQTVRAFRHLLARRDATVPVRLRLDDTGVTVFHGSGDTDATVEGDAGRPAYLAWDDCIAVVASRTPVPDGDGRPLFYVHFMPRTDGAVRLEGVPAERIEWMSRLCGIPSTTGAAMAWVLVSVDLPAVPRVLAQVASRAPHVRVVDSLRRAPA
jgi:hypothetical protein